MTSTMELAPLNKRLDLVSLKAETAAANWNDFISAPYGEAYEKAFNNFQSTLNIANANTQKYVDLAFIGLALVGGTVITATLGGSLRTAAGSALINFICNNNMQQLFNVVHFLSTNKAAQFAVGSALTTIEALSLTAAKQAVERGLASAQDPAEVLEQTPLQVVTAMGHFTDRCKSAVVSAVSEALMLRSPEHRGLIYKDLINSPFMSPPDSAVYTNKDKLVCQIEYAFYLNHILNTDFVRIGSTRFPIDVSPDDALYPQNIGIPTGPGPVQTVGYDRVSQTFVDRINQVHRGAGFPDRLIDSNHFGQRMDAGILRRAEANLRKLGQDSQAYTLAGNGRPLIVDDRIQSLKG